MKEANKMATEEFSERLERYKRMEAQNKRRSELGVRLNIWENEPFSFLVPDSRYNSVCSSDLLGTEKLTRSDRWKLLRRSKNYLARRFVDAECFDSLTPFFRSKHPDWRDKNFPLLDYFSGLKYSYSSPLPVRVISKRRGDDVVSGSVEYFDLSFDAGGSSKKARVSDLVRSRSIRLDPVDSPKQMFLYRLRIRRCISWGYSLGYVPVMMTLTLFHRWHPLKGLLNVLSNAWNYFFTGTRMATRRAEKIGLVGYIRRAEETINNKSRRNDGTCSYNSGWHPHYHVILFVPREKVSVLSSMEDEFREAWYQAVNRYFELEFGEQIAPSYENSFRRHGLVFSRYFDKQHVCSNDTSIDLPEQRPPLREVDDSEYVAKIFGCEANTLYGGDTEMTSSGVKNSIIPFDLLCEDTAENNDLWVEYALATKGVKSFFFSRGLEGRVQKYFEMFPDRDPVKPLPKSDNVVAQISRDAYHFFYRSFKVDEMLRIAAGGYEVLRDWCRRTYIDSGFREEDITEEMLPQVPGSRSWVIDERRRPLTNRVDVLTKHQTQSKREYGDGRSSLVSTCHEQSGHACVVRPECEETRVNDNLCHISEEASVSVTSSESSKSRRLFSPSRRVVYQPSLFEPGVLYPKTRRDDIPSVGAVESPEKISRAKRVEPVDPRRQEMLDLAEKAMDSVSRITVGFSSFEQYLRIWSANNDSANSCREFLQSQPQEVLDVKALVDSLPLVSVPEPPPPRSPSLPSSVPTPSSPTESSSSSPAIPAQSQSSSAQQLIELSPSSAASSLESESSLSSGVQSVCDSEETGELSPFARVASSPTLTIDGAYVGDFVPRVALRSPIRVIQDTCADIINSGQSIDWAMIQRLVDELGDDSLSAIDLVDGVRRGLDESDLSDGKSSAGTSSATLRPAYLDEEVDNSFQARYEEVAKSKWYPAWYRVRMAALAQASKKAAKEGTTELKIDGAFFMLTDPVE